MQGVCRVTGGSVCRATRQAAPVALQGPHEALHDGVDHLEVARVRGDRDLHAAAAAQLPVRGVPEVVLHVPDAEGALAALHLRAHLAEGLTEEVVQHVEAAAVCHADLELSDALARGLLAEELQRRDDALDALQAEALRRRELGGQEALEHVCECGGRVQVAGLGRCAGAVGAWQAGLGSGAPEVALEVIRLYQGCWC